MRIRIGTLLMAICLTITIISGCSKPTGTSTPDSTGTSSSAESTADKASDVTTAGTDGTTADPSQQMTTSKEPGGKVTSVKTTVSAGNKQKLAVEKKMLPLTSNGDGLLLENPDRGFRTEFVFNVRAAANSGDPAAYIYKLFDVYFNTLGEPCKLMLGYVYITEYRKTEIDDAGIEAIKIFFDLCRSKRVKLMLRFAYCDSFLNLGTGADQTTIIRHIKQLAPLVKENADVIHTISCGFVGSYGEWAEVYQVPKVDYKTVMKTIVKYLAKPNGIYFSIRLPRYKNLIDKSDPDYAWISHNNDAMFGAQNKKDWESEHYQLGSAEWTQVMKEGYATPQDGEMFTNQNLVETNRKPSGMEIMLETTQHRHTSMSFWHGYRDVGGSKDAVMTAWKTEYVTPELLKKNHIVYCPSWFKNDKGQTVKRNAFEYIRDHLGYKLEAQTVSIKGSNKPGSTAKVSMSLKNYGMSAVFNLESGFAILDQDYNVVSRVKAGSPKSWHSHSPTDYTDDTVLTHVVQGDMKLPTKGGRYYVAFYLKNTMDDFARLSNRIETADGYNILHAFDL